MELRKNITTLRQLEESADFIEAGELTGSEPIDSVFGRLGSAVAVGVTDGRVKIALGPKFLGSFWVRQGQPQELPRIAHVCWAALLMLCLWVRVEGFIDTSALARGLLTAAIGSLVATGIRYAWRHLAGREILLPQEVTADSEAARLLRIAVEALNGAPDGDERLRQAFPRMSLLERMTDAREPFEVSGR